MSIGKSQRGWRWDWRAILNIPPPGTPPEFASHVNVVEVCLHLSYIIVICQLTTVRAVARIAAHHSLNPTRMSPGAIREQGF